jgi:hypothetical protein
MTAAVTAPATGQCGLADGAENHCAQNRGEECPGCFHRCSLRGNAILYNLNAFILVGADRESRFNV